jgi:hypothetical protein
MLRASAVGVVLGMQGNGYRQRKKQHAQRQPRPIESIADHTRAFAAIFAELPQKAMASEADLQTPENCRSEPMLLDVPKATQHDNSGLRE